MSALEAALAGSKKYRALHTKAMSILAEAEDHAAETIENLEAVLAAETDQLNALTRSAGALPDGSKVFRAADGTLWTADGEDVSHLEDHIIWRGDKPSWEEFVAQRDRVANITDQLDAWRHYQTDVLCRARDRLSDPDNPPSASEIEDILDDIEDKMPSSAEAEIEQELKGADTSASLAALPSI